MAKVVTPDPLVPGRDAVYQITVVNSGPSDSLADVLTDPLPEGLTVRTPGPTASQGSCEMVGRTASCALGTLRAGQSTVVRIPITVDPGLALTSVTNTAAITSTTPDTDPDPAGRTGTVTTQVTPLADLTLVKTGPAAVLAGDGMSWTLTLTNSGPSAAQQATITDPVPAAVTGLAISATQGSCTIASNTVTCGIGTLAPGDSARITLFVTGAVDPSYLGAGIDNTATVSSPTPEPGDDPAAGRSSTAHTDVSAQADLLVSKVPSATSFTAGQAAAWTVTVTNLGPSTATGVELTDQLPAALRNPVFTDTGGSVLSCPAGVCDFATLAPGDAATVVVSGTVDPDLAADAITNTASVAATTADPVQGNNNASSRVPVGGSAHLVLDKTGPSSVVAGETVTWSIAVSNPDGPSTARGVRVTDDLPAGITDITVTTPASIICPAHPDSGSTLTCDLPDLVAGAAPLTIRISATVVAGHPAGTLVNTARATSDTTQTDPGSGDDTDTFSTPVITRADLSITKTGPRAVVAGRPISWTVRVSSAGPSVARAVTVVDQQPAGVTGLTGTWSGGTCESPCALGDVAPGQTVVITYTGTVRPDSTAPTQANAATVSSTTADPDTTDNSATSSTDIGTSADLSLVKTVSPDPLVPGDPVTYTLEVHNAGPSDAAGVLVTDPLPSALADVTSTTGSCSITGGVLSCDIGVVASGADVTVTVHATLSDIVDPGTVSNTASVTASTSDPDLSNNSSIASAGTATCAVGTLAAGRSFSTTVRGTLDPSYRGALTNTASVTSGVPDPHPGNNSVSTSTAVGLDSDLSISKIADRGVVTGSELVKYSITVTQQGVGFRAGDGDRAVAGRGRRDRLHRDPGQLRHRHRDLVRRAGRPRHPGDADPVGAAHPRRRGHQHGHSDREGHGSHGFSVRPGSRCSDHAADQPDLPTSPTSPTSTSTPPPPPTSPSTSSPPPPPPGELPNTGVPAERMTMWGLALLLAGAAALVLGTRRRTRQPRPSRRH